MVERSIRTSITLPWALDRPPLSLTFAPDEFAKLAEIAAESGLTVSDWIRKVISYGTLSGGTDIGQAATNARMPLAAWVRLLVLEAAGITNLHAQIEAAIRLGRVDRRDYVRSMPYLVGVGGSAEAAEGRFRASLADARSDGFVPDTNVEPRAFERGRLGQHEFGYFEPFTWKRAHP